MQNRVGFSSVLLDESLRLGLALFYYPRLATGFCDNLSHNHTPTSSDQSSALIPDSTAADYDSGHRELSSTNFSAAAGSKVYTVRTRAAFCRGPSSFLYSLRTPLPNRLLLKSILYES